MRHLVVDGYLSGTSIRDTDKGEYVEHDTLEISSELSETINAWQDRYWNEFYKSYPDAEKVIELDKEGRILAIQLQTELPETEIQYFSDATMTKEDLMGNVIAGRLGPGMNHPLSRQEIENRIKYLKG